MTNELQIQTHQGQSGLIGQITLNRPKALNALSLAMLTGLQAQLRTWERDPQIQAVLITGSGERAFCAGGDIRAVYEYHHTHPNEKFPYFGIEYQLNKHIYHYTKPYLSYLNGITMGGGAGISLLGSHPIASENTHFAMPETAIGFFPDVGAGHFLKRCPDKLGWYLGLTGNTIQADDVIGLGLVKHLIPTDAFSDFFTTLLERDLSQDADKTITELLTVYHQPPSASPLLAKQDTIDRCFRHDTMEAIIEALQHENDPWCTTQAAILNSRSPLSLKVTLALLKQCETLSFDDIIARNLALSEHFMQDHDFAEGIRAAVIDKDKTPIWQPATLAEVTSTMVAEYC